MNCTKHFDLGNSLTASCVARFMICWLCRLYFSGLVCSVLSLNECLIKINYGWFCVCFRCPEKVILWSRLCLAKDEFRYHRFCHLERIIYGGKLEWCDLLTFSNVARVKYSIVTSHLHLHIHLFYYVGKICTEITPIKSRAKREDYTKADTLQSAVSILYLVYIMYPVCIFYKQVSVAPIKLTFGYSYSHNTHNLPQNTSVRVNSTFSFFSALILFFPFVRM